MYPPGTKCRITWAHPEIQGVGLIGEEVVVIGPDPSPFMDGLHGLTPLAVDPLTFTPTEGHTWHPAEWMRPIDDEKDMDKVYDREESLT